MIDKIRPKVIELLQGEKTMHDWEHTLRVYNNAMVLAEEEPGCDKEVVAMAALLHECDDYKIFGQECAKNLSNTKRILQQCNVEEDKVLEVLEIVANIGFSKYLTGTQKLNLNGKIVQDADMLDAQGAIGAVRTIVFNVMKGSGKSFDKNIFPRDKLTKDVYQNKVKEETAINHMFEKLLKLKDMMYTKSGKCEAEIRYKSMVDFLYEFFREMGLPEWTDYLNTCTKNK